MAHTSDSVPETPTPACTPAEVVLTGARYHAFASLFDALADLSPRAFGDRIQLHGSEAGQALQIWARERGFSVEAVNLTRAVIGGGSVMWTMLSMLSPTITIHLDESPVRFPST